jgi:hypothetical protein
VPVFIGNREFSFDDVLVNTVSRVFMEVLGETGASFVYCQLRRRHGLDRGLISERIEPFGEGMIKLLGSGGEAILNMIVNGVAEELGVKPPRGRSLKFEAKLKIICDECEEIEF